MSALNKVIDEISIDTKYCGPPDVANGGYLAGRLASYFERSGVNKSISVSLRAATPLNTRLNIVEKAQDTGKVLQLMEGQTQLAIANETQFVIHKPECPVQEQIASVRMRCAGYANHPFPACFVCGPERPLGDGLAIYPGPVAPKTPSDFPGSVVAEWALLDTLKDHQGQVKTEFVWAAMDCISAFAILEPPEHQHLTPMVLGKLSVNREQELVGDRAYVMAWPGKVDGRKAFANSAVFNQQQQCIAVGQALWVSLNKL